MRKSHQVLSHARPIIQLTFLIRNFSVFKKWLLTSIVTMSVLAITLTSSAYSGSSGPIVAEFGASKELYALGVVRAPVLKPRQQHHTDQTNQVAVFVCARIRHWACVLGASLRVVWSSNLVHRHACLCRCLRRWCCRVPFHGGFVGFPIFGRHIWSFA